MPSLPGAGCWIACCGAWVTLPWDVEEADGRMGRVGVEVRGVEVSRGGAGGNHGLARSQEHGPTWLVDGWVLCMGLYMGLYGLVWSCRGSWMGSWVAVLSN